MDKEQLSKALEISKDRAGIDFAKTNLHLFDGFGLNDFKPIVVRLEDVADLIRWQCSQLDGGFNLDNLHEIAKFGKTRFIVL